MNAVPPPIVCLFKKKKKGTKTVLQSSTLGVFKTKISASVILSVGGGNELQKKLKR